MLPYRERQYRKDISLFVNSAYAGFQKLDTIEEYFEEYSQLADKTADNLSFNSVVLYAITEYIEQEFISANFMLLEMPYEIYIEIAHKLQTGRRLFFVRGRKDYNEQN